MNTEIVDMNTKNVEVAMTTLAAMSQAPEKFTATEIKNFYENIIAKLPCLVVWKDKDFKYVYCNEITAVDFLKLSSPREIIGKTDFDLSFNFEAAKFLRQVDEEIVKTGKPALNIETTFEMDDGRIVHLSTNRMPLFDSAGEVIGILGVGVDITDQKETEALKLENERQQIALQEKENFALLARKVAHDINSPLAALKVLAERCDALPEDQRSLLRRATESILDIANNLVNSYQKKDQPPSNEKELRAPLLVSDLLIQLLSEKKVQYTQRSVTFKTEFVSEANFAFIHMQKTEFRRMMSNLINNAVDALENKSGSVIIIQLTVDANIVTIKVQDNGKGMSSDQVQKMVERQSFTEGKENGHGLGLQQVWDTLGYNQGVMKVQSVLGQGTTIQLTFPRIPAAPWIAQDIHLTPDSIILILDDDESIHTAWNIRFTPFLSSYPALRIHHFTLGPEVLVFLATLTQEEKKHAIFLSDYELLHQSRNGLAIVQISGIKSSILVTSYYSDPKIREVTDRLEIKILPKQMASVIPIYMDSTATSVHQFDLWN